MYVPMDGFVRHQRFEDEVVFRLETIPYEPQLIQFVHPFRSLGYVARPPIHVVDRAGEVEVVPFRGEFVGGWYLVAAGYDEIPVLFMVFLEHFDGGLVREVESRDSFGGCGRCGGRFGGCEGEVYASGRYCGLDVVDG